jgi:hypothetical protein
MIRCCRTVGSIKNQVGLDVFVLVNILFEPIKTLAYIKLLALNFLNQPSKLKQH